MKNPTESYVLVVDDDKAVLEAVSLLLRAKEYQVIACSNSMDALNHFGQSCVDLVLTDMKMPGITGLELLENVKVCDGDVPVIIMTGYAEIDTAISALRNGAFDFLIKPFRPEYLFHAVEKAVKHRALLLMEKNYKASLEKLVQSRTEELASAMEKLKGSSLEVIKRLTTIAEYRDTDTSDHISRIGLYVNSVAKELNMPRDFVETITFASPMHDIGKIGIPDRLLLKNGPLEPDEYENMKEHTIFGHRMLSDSSHYILQMAASIALTHHERWDGSGYPGRLKGKEIPDEGMIVMICDVYDSLRSRRPYKSALSHAEAMKVITEGDGRTETAHFSPKILSAFVSVAPEIEKIAEDAFSLKTPS